MKAFKCDRCYEFYQGYSPTLVTHPSGAAHVQVTITAATMGQQSRDYCKSCLLKTVQGAYA